MKFAEIISAEAIDALFPLVDDVEVAEIEALVSEELGADMAAVDALVDAADRELVAAERAESFRVSHALTDQVRARRAYRRVGREVLRSLPVQLGAAGDGRAA